jgi:hypothetical protein
MGSRLKPLWAKDTALIMRPTKILDEKHLGDESRMRALNSGEKRVLTITHGVLRE